MPGKFAFAAFVAALFAIPRSTVVQAQAHLQPRDTLPTQNNSTQDYILPRDDLTSTSANTTYSAKSKRAQAVEKIHTPSLTIPLSKSSTSSQYTGIISVELRDMAHPDLTLRNMEDFRVVYSTVARDNMWLVSYKVKGTNFGHKFDHNGLAVPFRAETINVNTFGGSGTGTVYETRVRIEHLALEETFVGALETIEGFGGEVGDGVVPLARSGLKTSMPNTAWNKLIGSREYDASVIAIALRLSRGQLCIGMIDNTAYDGDIQYYNCDLSSKFWAVKDASIRVAKKEVKMKRIIFDTTSQFIRGPKSKVKEIYKFFDSKYNFKFDEELGLYTFPCNIELELPKISIHVGTSESPWWMTEPKLFKQSIPTHVGLCFGLLAPHTKITVAASLDWLMPPPVDHYTILDWGKLPDKAVPHDKGKTATIGIAKLKPEFLAE